MDFDQRARTDSTSLFPCSYDADLCGMQEVEASCFARDLVGAKYLLEEHARAGSTFICWSTAVM
jgi:peroxiredoxin family protein